MHRSSRPAPFTSTSGCLMIPLLVLLTLAPLFCDCAESITMSVEQYPARIYQNAPQGVPIVKVTAYSNTTGNLVNFKLEQKYSARHFQVGIDGYIRTASTINYDVGKEFDFFVSALYDGVPVEHKHVKIIVSERNKFNPVFKLAQYYKVYRYGIGDVIGYVTATDNDPQPYNRMVNIYSEPGQQVVLNYVKVSRNGVLTLTKAMTSADSMDLKLIAKDTGSPPKTGRTQITIDLTDIRQPQVFCQVSTETSVTLCWKNPMRDKSFSGYTVNVSGAMRREDFLPILAGHEEACYTLNNTELGKLYVFTVMVKTGDYWYGQAKQISFNNTGAAISPVCESERFSTCSYLLPCKNGGTCTPTAGNPSTNGLSTEAPEEPRLSYTCTCAPGWEGYNCTVKDGCHNSPCGDHGSCIHLSEGRFACSCKDDYFGDRCQNYNTCLLAPCINGGKCEIHADGTYTCECPPLLSGDSCEVHDPCSPDPCIQGQGQCVKMTDTEARCECFKGYYGDTCGHRDECLLFEPCLLGGKCINTLTAYRCECTPGRIGKHCELNDPCFIRPCRNNATCSMGSNGAYACTCLPGYYGSECQTLDACYGVDCNNGTCQVDAQNKPICHCEKGFHGVQCLSYNACDAVDTPCFGRGVCTSHSSGVDRRTANTEYTCVCESRYYGPNCENVNQCFPKVCTNGGECVEGPANTFDCRCPNGQYLEDCSKTNACLDHPCDNDAECVPSTNSNSNSNSSGGGGGAGFWCNCLDGWLGDLCEARSPCADDRNPCLNDGSCSVMEFAINDDRHFKANCSCISPFLGRFCERANACWNNQCLHGTCVPRVKMTPDESSYYCNCSDGYTGDKCELPVDKCKTVKCNNGGYCQAGNCICPVGYSGLRCETPVEKCIDGVALSNSACHCLRGIIHCFDCQSGQGGSGQCLNSGMGMTFRCCSDTSANTTGTGAKCQIYSPTCSNRSHCSEAGVPDARCQYYRNICSQTQRRCNQFAPAELSCLDMSRKGDRGWIKCAQDKLTSLNISDPSSLDASQVAQMAQQVVEEIGAALEKQEVAQIAMDVINGLSDVNVSVSEEVERLNGTNTRMRGFLNDYTANVSLHNGSVTLATKGFVVKATSVDEFTNKAIEFMPSISDSDTMSDMSISLPQNLLSNDEYGISKNSRLEFIGYRKSQLFTVQQPFDNDNGGEEFFTGDGDVISRQRVISASVSGVKLTNLSEPVKIVLPAIEKGFEQICVFWDENNSNWSTEGVITEYDASSGKVTCLSNHLTSFAVLMSPTPSALKSEIGLTYITYIGSGISSASLIFTIVTYGLFKCLHGEKSGKILLQLCASLLFLNIVFLCGSVDVSSFSEKVCTGIALLLHYFLMSTLFWMLIEAIEMYRAIVTVFIKYESFHLAKRCLIGWGIPAVIIATTASIDIGYYGSNSINEEGEEQTKICFMTPGGDNIAYYASLLGPACLIILINSVVFILVVRVIMRPRFQQRLNANTAPFTPAQVRGAFTVMFLLGITWIFGPLAIGEATLVFSYLFCICNSLQGFLIFIFRCLFNPEARMAWTQLYQTGTLKRRRGPIKSAYMDSSSCKDGHDTSSTTRRLSNSTNVTLSTGVTTTTPNNSVKLPLYRGVVGGMHAHPHQLHTTNGWHPNLNGMKRDNGFNGGSGGENVGVDAGSFTIGEDNMLRKNNTVEAQPTTTTTTTTTTIESPPSCNVEKEKLEESESSDSTANHHFSPPTKRDSYPPGSPNFKDEYTRL